MELLLYTSCLTNRLRYVGDLVFGELMGFELVYITEQQDFIARNGFKVNYSETSLDGTSLFIPQHDLLKEQGLQKQVIEVFQVKGLPAFFKIEATSADLPFDLLAMVFYLVTRYEEYLDFKSDAHGRFPAKESLAFKAGFLEEPLIEQWVIQLKELLKKQYPSIQFRKQAYRFLASYDIDFAWSYRYKGMYRTVAAYARDLLKLNFSNLWERFLVQTGQKKDPYFVFEYLDQLHQKRNLQPQYFFLLGDYGPFDKSNQYQAKAFQDLIQQTIQKYPVGIHPSYASNSHLPKLEQEIKRLHTITQQTVKSSRQHFLKLQFPTSYQSLLANGIEADYSMGYAAMPGFRASISRDFFWYDLSTETQTSLRIHPFQVMDVTLKVYQKLDRTKALIATQKIIDKIRTVDGCFVSLWHNSSLTEIEGWEGWRATYEQILTYAKNSDPFK